MQRLSCPRASRLPVRHVNDYQKQNPKKNKDYKLKKFVRNTSLNAFVKTHKSQKYHATKKHYE
jgi:hypothetical protein